MLDAYAGVCVLINARTARLFDVVHRAAGDSPELTQLWATLRATAASARAPLVAHARTLGPIRADLTVDQVADALWTLNDPALYGRLVLEKGWSEADFRRWLARQMAAAVLP